MTFNLKKKRRSLSSLEVGSSSDQQGGVVVNENRSQFYNFASAYNIILLKRGLSFITAYNVSYNTIGRNSFLTMGPTAGIIANLFENKLTTGFTYSYNFSSGQGSKLSSVLNLRANASYKLFKKHTMNLSIINQNRWLIKVIL